MACEFKIFDYTCETYNDFWLACDTPMGRGDSERSKLCCRQCQFWCLPFCCIFDIISCPVRFCNYYCCCSESVSLTSQPKMV